MKLLVRLCGFAALAAGLVTGTARGAGVDPADLLPVEEAFRLSATAPERGRIEIHFEVADGYYLYRHRMGASADGFDGQARWPDGTPHVDEFFGEVETYRQRVTGVLEGSAEPALSSLHLQVRYQGCADVGVCYPPDTRTVRVALPAAGGSAGGGDGLAALARALEGGSPATGAAGMGTGLDGSVQPLPLPEEQAFGFEAIADGGDTILMRFTPAPGYYLYRDRSAFRVDGAAGIGAGDPRWPAGTRHSDPYFGDTVVYFDQVEVPLPLRRSHPDPAGVTLTATFQGCQDEGICYPPMTRTVQLSLPPLTGSGSLPLTAGGGPETGSGSLSRTSAPTGAGPEESEPDPVSDSGNAVRSTAPPVPRGGLIGALVLGLLGGLVLNLMPCVLPILSLKVVGLVQSGGNRSSARRHALWYTLGVLCAFAAIGALVLGLRATGLALGWGFQLQQPWFVALLVYLMFAVGLSLSGVFSVGGGRLGAAGQKLASKSGRAGDFFTGVLACVVASPCIAPFMGGALAFAFTASAPVAMTVFLALGLGLALPFLLVGFIPALASRLPRPGPWMETLQRFMAFPMYLAAIWLAWVLGRQHGVDAMALVAVGLVLLALGLWWYERKRWTGSVAGRLAATAVLLLALLPVAGVARLEPAGPDARIQGDAQAWSPERLQALRDEGRAVFVNMTADWCVTCKANEQRVLGREPFRNALAETGAAYLVGDWTNVDPRISGFLEEHGAVGVPLYVVYPAGGGAGEVLPALLSDEIAIGALHRAAR